MDGTIFADQLKKEFFQIGVAVRLGQVTPVSLRQEAAPVQNGHLVTKSFRFAHDVRGEDDAFSLVSQGADGIQ